MQVVFLVYPQLSPVNKAFQYSPKKNALWTCEWCPGSGQKIIIPLTRQVCNYLVDFHLPWRLVSIKLSGVFVRWPQEGDPSRLNPFMYGCQHQLDV